METTPFGMYRPCELYQRREYNYMEPMLGRFRSSEPAPPHEDGYLIYCPTEEELNDDVIKLEDDDDIRWRLPGDDLIESGILARQGATDLNTHTASNMTNGILSAVAATEPVLHLSHNEIHDQDTQAEERTNVPSNDTGGGTLNQAVSNGIHPEAQQENRQQEHPRENDVAEPSVEPHRNNLSQRDNRIVMKRGGEVVREYLPVKKPYGHIDSCCCDICRLYFKRYRGREDERPAKCTFCDKAFRHPSHLRRHMMIHTGERPFKCPLCEKAFVQKNSLESHMVIHLDEKRYLCSYCGKAFLREHGLKNHLRTHTGERPYKCGICGKAFSGSSGYRKHMRRHEGIRQHKCNVCSKMFLEKNHLTIHMRTHTGERPFQCKFCPKTFSQRKMLASHTRTHTGERPFTCKVCNKAFLQSSTLHVHKRIHTGAKPYKCSVCKKEFSQDCSLKRHMRTHTGEKPYQCSICNKRFTQDTGLHKHMETHKKNKSK